MLPALQGRDAPGIAETLGRARSSVQAWVYAYRDGGLEALADKPRPGRTPRLDAGQLQAPAEHLDAHNDPAKHPDGTRPLRGREIRRFIAETFGVEYSLDGVYGLLGRLGFSVLRPRPRHPENDPADMERWTADAPLLSGG